MSLSLLTHWWRCSPTWQSRWVCRFVPYTSTSTVFDSNARVVNQRCDNEYLVLINTHQDKSTPDKPSQPATVHLAWWTQHLASRGKHLHTPLLHTLDRSFKTTIIVYCLWKMLITAVPQSSKKFDWSKASNNLEAENSKTTKTHIDGLQGTKPIENVFKRDEMWPERVATSHHRSTANTADARKMRAVSTQHRRQTDWRKRLPQCALLFDERDS